MRVQLTEARAHDVTNTLLPSAALDGAADMAWGASLELQLRCLRRMQPANFKSMAAFARWQVGSTALSAAITAGKPGLMVQNTMPRNSATLAAS